MDGVAVGKALLEKTGNLKGKRICKLCYLKAFRSSFRIFFNTVFYSRRTKDAQREEVADD